MKGIGIIFTAVIITSACNIGIKKRPIWLNPCDTLTLPETKPMQFSTPYQKVAAELLTSAQPINLLVIQTNNTARIDIKQICGINEGSAQVCLILDKQCFFYPVYIVNKRPAELIYKDYRSPKTVNPDSGLLQQRVFHQMDIYRNLHPRNVNGAYFHEDEIALAHQAGIYRAQPQSVLSSYYVQPGSCTSIPISSKFSSAENTWHIIVGPLKDRYNNTLAQGTLVTFQYHDSHKYFQTEVSVQKGMAFVSIPARNGRKYELQAEICGTRSKITHLK